MAPPFKHILLDYEATGKTITVSQDSTRLNKNGRPNKVKWVVSADDDYYWKVEWNAAKSGGQANHLGGPFIIDCSDLSEKSPRFQPGADRDWAYSVTVYACPYEDGDPELAKLDPRIIWR